jgi:hypothetical protein
MHNPSLSAKGKTLFSFKKKEHWPISHLIRYEVTLPRQRNMTLVWDGLS